MIDTLFTAEINITIALYNIHKDQLWDFTNNKLTDTFAESDTLKEISDGSGSQCSSGYKIECPEKLSAGHYYVLVFFDVPSNIDTTSIPDQLKKFYLDNRGSVNMLIVDIT